MGSANVCSGPFYFIFTIAPKASARVDGAEPGNPIKAKTNDEWKFGIRRVLFFVKMLYSA